MVVHIIAMGYLISRMLRGTLVNSNFDKRVHFLNANLYSDVKIKLNSVKTCKNEAKVN